VNAVASASGVKRASTRAARENVQHRSRSGRRGEFGVVDISTCGGAIFVVRVTALLSRLSLGVSLGVARGSEIEHHLIGNGVCRSRMAREKLSAGLVAQARRSLWVQGGAYGAGTFRDRQKIVCRKLRVVRQGVFNVERVDR
jgi:hypothetical protein